MNTREMIVLASAVVVVDACVFFGLRMWIKSKFEPLMKAFPRRPARTGAVRKRWQSFAVDSTNFSNCIAIAMDDEYMHVQPMWLARVLGAPELSVPRSAITNTKQAHFGYATAKVGQWTIAAPGWALEAAPARSR